MFKLIKKLILLAIIALIVFVVLSLYSGGEKFRWFGKKVEQQSEKVGEKADKFKKKSGWVLRGVEWTREKVKDLTGKKDEKSH